ncbi:vWA domain-containing protein [Chitinophaga sancti]|uniref:Mg-chelatase subunit ChlD n=1 Tax=Chitinophaga sancti TaxID=1004 RepID=A0A1K1NHW4_9BACT|nr:VWA domain-containing protein [Chitinophaga sancti]WQD63203.1 VWA domain-containing protein [Chitinophaga sancti]WQG91171.1 VWA domain-containing protein [Chitinophaga sancti]SFW35024.1 Mg-chelatase subunit ChlD [Chitinophaga sancti]
MQTTPVIGNDYKTRDLLATVRNYLISGHSEIKYQRKAFKSSLSLLFLIDSSGSMIKDRQIAYIKGVIAQTITQHRHKRLRYGAVALSQGAAQLVSHYTTDSDRFIQSIGLLSSGGKTNLKAGLQLIEQLQPTKHVQLYIFTDGKINVGGSLQEAGIYFKQHLRELGATTVVNIESGFVKLGRAAELARVMGATLLNL